MSDTRDQYAPRYQLYVNDKLVDSILSSHIKQVNVEDDSDVFDKISIKISAQQITETGQVTDIIDSKAFTASQLISVKMGYGKIMNTVGAGEIIKVIPNFGREGPTLEVIAYDPFHRLASKKHRELRSYSGTNISGTFKEIIESHGGIFGKFTTDIKDTNNTKKHASQPVGKSDFEYLKSLADTRGLDFYNRYNDKTKAFDVYLKEPNDDGKPEFTFTYYEHEEEPLTTLLDFSPDMNTSDQISDLEIVSWDKNTKVKIKTYEKTPNKEGGHDIKFKGPDKTAKLKGGDNGGQVKFKAFGESFEVITDKPFASQEGAKLFAEAWLKQRLNNFILGSGTLIGVEALSSRTVITLKGIGTQFSGNYIVTTAIHNMSDGNIYTTKVNVRKVVKI